MNKERGKKMKKYMNNEMKFEELSNEVQEEVKRNLKSYSETNVIFENGKYTVSPAIMIKKVYAEDHRFIGVYYAEDIFTKEERIVNYAESFHDFSPEYKGKRDYMMMKEVGYDWNAKFKIENGMLVKA